MTFERQIAELNYNREAIERVCKNLSVIVLLCVLIVLFVKKVVPLIKKYLLAVQGDVMNTSIKNNIITSIISTLASPLPSIVILWFYFLFCNLMGETYGYNQTRSLLDISSMAVPALIIGVVLILLCYVLKKKYAIKYYMFALAFVFSGMIVLFANQGVLSFIKKLSDLNYYFDYAARSSYVIIGTVCSLAYLLFIPFGLFIDILLKKNSPKDDGFSPKAKPVFDNTEHSEPGVIKETTSIKQPKEKKPRDYRISEKQAGRKKRAVKALIWLLYITIYSVLQTAIGMYVGNIGSFGTLVFFGLAMLFANLHCKSYEERFHEKWTVISDTKEDTNTSQEAN